MLVAAKALAAKAGGVAFSLASLLALRALFFIHDFRRPISLLLYVVGDFLGRVRRRLLHIALSLATGVVTGAMFLALASAALTLSWDALSGALSFVPWWALLLALAPLILYASFVVGAWAGLAVLVLPLARHR
ncbi:MAG: hypothetical protein QXH27_05925 [Candidatus Micrarchaeia archaeon]